MNDIALVKFYFGLERYNFEFYCSPSMSNTIRNFAFVGGVVCRVRSGSGPLSVGGVVPILDDKMPDSYLDNGSFAFDEWRKSGGCTFNSLDTALEPDSLSDESWKAGSEALVDFGFERGGYREGQGLSREDINNLRYGYVRCPAKANSKWRLIDGVFLDADGYAYWRDSLMERGLSPRSPEQLVGCYRA